MVWALGRSLAVASSLGACGSIAPIAPTDPTITDPTRLYMTLTLNAPAVNLDTTAGYNTVKLVATPRDALGQPMAGLPAPSFHSSDTTAVQVSADGMVTALKPAGDVRVIASVTLGPVTHDDTAHVKVTTAVPTPLDTLSIHPVPPDSATWPALAPGDVGFGGAIFNAVGLANGLYDVQARLRAVDAAGQAIDGLVVAYRSLDPSVALIDRWNGTLTPLQPGLVRLAAETWAYGITKADTVNLTITLPVVYDIGVYPGNAGGARLLDFRNVPASDIRIAPYGIVSWFNHTADSVDITFDDLPPLIAPPPLMCFFFVLFTQAEGPDVFCDTNNVLMPPFLAAPDDPDFLAKWLLTYRVRQFPTPGVYSYHSVRAGVSGRIVVSAE